VAHTSWSSIVSSATLCLIASSAGSLALAGPPPLDPRPQRASLSYFGDNVTRPGLRLGYEGAAWLRRPQELIIGGSIGGHAVEGGYALFALLEGGYRLTLPVGLFFDARVGIGYEPMWRSATPAPGTPSGQVVQTVTNYFVYSATGGLGYDFYRRFQVPLSVFVRGGGLGRYVSVEAASGNFLLDAGLAFQLGTSRAATQPLPVPEVPIAEAPSDPPPEAAPGPASQPPPSASSPLQPLPVLPAGSAEPLPQR